MRRTQKSSHRRRILVWMAGMGLAAGLSGCGDDSGVPALPTPGPGVIFSYPFDGQQDVLTSTRIVVSFSDQVNTAAVADDCTSTGPGNASGAFCVLGPNGLLDNVAEVVGPEGNVIHFDSDQLEPGTTYEVFVGPSALAVEATNLTDGAPLFTFQTRQENPRTGAPEVRAVNGDDPTAFTGEGPDPRFPTLDFTTFRVLFSEPINPDTVTLGGSFEFVEVDGGNETPVAGALIVKGIHLSFDPESDLNPGATYRMRLGNQIRDLGGESLVESVYEFRPQDSRMDDGSTILQTLNAEPALGDPDFPRISSIAGSEINALTVNSPLLGENAVDLRDGNVEAVMADTVRFGTQIPITIRKGQFLKSSGLEVFFGGVIPADVETGDLQITFISDASGILTRNPFRAADVLPDDREAPVFAYLTLDVAVTAEDDKGHTILNQTLLGVQVAGVAIAADGSLIMEAVGTMELDLLGVARAPANMVMSLGTAPDQMVPDDTTAPTLTAAFPRDTQDSFLPPKSLQLIFSEPLDLGRIVPQTDILLTEGGGDVDFKVDSDGSTLVITPRQPLSYGRTYTLTLTDTLYDYAGNAWSRSPGDPSGGDGVIEFDTPVLSGSDPTPPLLASVYPGVPCALTDAGPDSPGRCVDSESGDDRYGLFELPANRFIEATFTLPINPGSMDLGTQCGEGSVRVEVYDGGCVNAVSGSLLKSERSLRFFPDQPFTVGQEYRLTLRGGSNNSCGNDELCGINGQPLNTDALGGSEDGDGGGPDAVFTFVATEPTTETFLPAGTFPQTDINGNGFIDNGEIARDENRGAMLITGWGGIVSEASFVSNEDCLPGNPDEGCLYLSAELPTSVGDPIDDCMFAGENVGTCIPLRLFPSIIYGTSVTMQARAVFNLTIDTGRVVMRVRDRPGEPIVAYLVEDADTGQPMLLGELEAYMDAPDLSILGGLANHDLRSKAVALAAAGPASFEDDGRIRLNLANVGDVEVTVNLEIIGIDAGSIDLQIPAGELKLQLVGHPYRGTQR